MPEPTSKEDVSQGCMRRMRRGINRESMYGEYTGGHENLKPVPVVQILRWQGTRKEWVVIDLVPEASEPCLAEKMSPSKKPHQEKMKNSCKKREGISSEQSAKMFSAKKTNQEKEVLKKSCKKPDTIKTCFCFDWKEKALAVPKCIKKVNDNENPTDVNKISSGDQSSKQTKVGDISKDHRNHANLTNEDATRAFENSPILPPKISLIQKCIKTNNKNSNIFFNPDGRHDCGITKRNSNLQGNHSKNAAFFEKHSDSSKATNGTFCKTATRDVEAEKVLKAAILVTEATIKTVEEMKAAKNCDIVLKKMGYKADIANEQRPVWKTAVAPNTKFQMSKQVDSNNSARVTPDQQITTSAESGNIQERLKQLQKSSRQCETEKNLKRSEAEKENILGLLNNLIYEVAKKKATKGEEALDDKSLKEAFGNDELQFADEEKENEEQAEKLGGREEKGAVDCAMKTLEEVNGFETSRSWY